MKLYAHPVSTTSRPVMQFIADNNIPADLQVIDIFTGEHMKEPYSKMNPNKLIPMLEDGDFRLTESSAILKYLADKINSPAYPKDLKQRARVNEVMDWFNSNLYRDFNYGVVYPQLFPSQKRANDEQQRAVIDWGKDRAKSWLQILNDNIIGKNAYLCGNEITIADYFGYAVIQVGEVIRCNYAQYPNIHRWMETMRKRPSTAKVYEVITGFAESVKAQPFVAV
ncbi:MAG TPA: glutathione S-transferase family protein [Stellaceae bacterium]|nr:glutathione S-transferase family protein [Stellaceae bacterium]